MESLQSIGGFPLSDIETKLYSAVLSDILDDLGYRHQALSFHLRPLDSSLKLVGRAFTVLAAEVFDIPDEPYKLQMEAVDQMMPGEIFVVHTGNPDNSAFWGELLSTACRARGGRGALVDGLNRDSQKIIEMKFPVFSRGQRPVDSKGRLDVIKYRVPVEVGGVIVNPGDLIFGDMDGVVIVPQSVEEEVLQKAFAKSEGENIVRQAIINGMSCTEAFRKFGIL